MKKYNIHTMGCKSNQFEGAIMQENLNRAGFTQTDKIEDADFYILNSCSVTHKSDNEAFYLLRAAKHKNPGVKTVLSGCIAQIEKEKLLEKDFIDYVIGNDEKLYIADYLNSSNKFAMSDVMTQNSFTQIELADTSKTRVSLKVQDGCDNRCSYCIIWKARGKSRSAKPDFIIKQINDFANHGFKEVVLTGIHIGQWGKDIGLNLLDLCKLIEFNTDIYRYRLGSLNPLEINDEFLNFLSTSSKFCPHFHLSLQSANDKTLRSMNRFYKTEDYLEQINQINRIFNLPFIGSDIIAGYTGETDEDFEITRQNLEQSALTQIHTFPYSQREGTVGAQALDQISESVKEQRANIIKEISRRKLRQFIQQNIGTEQEVLVEKHRDKHTRNLKGVTRNYLTIQIPSDKENLFNSIQSVKITKYENGKIYGEINR